MIDCAAYCGGVRVADVGIEQIRGALERNDQFVWLGLYEPEKDILRAVQQQFGLHDLAIEDAYNAHQRPKLELYEDSVFVVLRTAHLAPSPRHLEFGETHIFLGKNYVVTVRHGSLRSHIGVRQRCESTPQLLAKGPGYVLYALMDFVVDQYLPIVQQIEEEVEDLEETIFGEGRPATRPRASISSNAICWRCAERSPRSSKSAIASCASISPTSPRTRASTSATSTTTSSGSTKRSTRSASC